MAKNQRGFGAIEVLLVIVVVGLVGFGGWYVWHHSKTNTPTYGQSITFRGRYVCLDHKNQNGPQTNECGGGFLSASGSKIYEIDSEEYHKAHPYSISGDAEYVVTGILQPPGDFYSSDGIIRITNLKLGK